MSGTVTGIRTWSRKDGTTVLTVVLSWFGGSYECNASPANPDISKLGVGESVTVSVPFNEHKRFGFQAVQGAEPVLIKRGA